MKRLYDNSELFQPNQNGRFDWSLHARLSRWVALIAVIVGLLLVLAPLLIGAIYHG
jgi:hypothetical protein